MNRKPNRKPPVRQPKTIIYARCTRTRYGLGSRLGDIYMTTFSVAQWAKDPTCPNCGGGMVEIRKGVMPL